ncbi:MAG: hypothetical protein JWQ97_2449, partial [Phenylobacterium sp.]|nr:hypothetical protein [Phenylobacterium sp.]
MKITRRRQPTDFGASNDDRLAAKAAAVPSAAAAAAPGTPAAEVESPPAASARDWVLPAP